MTRSEPTVVVGFDLDMTLIDSRPGIAATYHELVRRTGVPIDVDLVVSRLGPPLEVELSNWFADTEVDKAAQLYRELYPELAIEPVRPLPGALAALTVAAARGETMVVTAKNERHARLHVEHLGLPVDHVAGGVWRGGKSEVLVRHRAGVYVGDHVHDMEAARIAEVPGLGVASGPCSEEELAAAGAAATLPDLSGFAAWFSEHV
ncbi:haloacid dehalogenase [Aeromicrobium sp. PE09-221]|uniref:HAD family hydrolase n=1 Tax=Aeromicrobium sp. PE09-221 TaxID=1898043 RepID=UPI000B3EAEB8|nr:HAD hydrolase-like protein [Aeromicrobium sp. PE09-221]OUZ10408.1 haloacid dehalogenase [Aeromicrobium sp. PE09-221]